MLIPIIMNKNPDAETTTDDSLPMTPVSETVDDDSDPLPEIAPLNPPPERKLTIRVPMGYTPPTPPPSASLPAIPPRRRSLAPVWMTQKKTLVTDDETPCTEAVSSTKDPVISAVSDAIKTVTLNVAVSVPEGKTTEPKTILLTPSPAHSAIHLPTVADKAQVQAQMGASEKKARYGAELLPTPTPLTGRPRPKSAPGQRNNAPDPRPPIRKSSSINNSPAHVSHIDFESSSEEEDEEEVESQAPSVEDDQKSSAHRTRAVSEESDFSRWAPEPVYFQNQSISVSYTVNAPPPPRKQWATRSRSSVSTSVRSGEREREGSTAGSTRRRSTTPKHHALLGLSSMPTEMVQRDVDFTTRALMSPEMFAHMLTDSLARQRFREFLAVEGSTAELDFWTDAQFLAQSMEQLRTNGLAFRDLYVSDSGEAHVPLSPEVRRELHRVLQYVFAADASLGSTQAHLLESMYNDQFQRFVKHKIIQEAHVTLGKPNLTSQQGEGLGDTFVLTNPRLPDHPIVLVSDGFVDVTGYPKAQIIGRNCRFLQGPGTPPASVQRIRDGLNSGKGRNGEPFYCLLCIIPVRDTSGTIVYFIGGQTNVTGLLATDKNLGIHVAHDGAAQQPIQMSPALALLREQTSGMAPSAVADPSPRTRGAAGAVASQSRSHNGGGFFRGLFGRGGPSTGVSARSDEKQVIPGAEAMMNVPGARGFQVEQDQYAMFRNTYNKILIFKFKKREITFVSPQMLGMHKVHLDLPTRTQRELYASPLVRNDIASLVTAGEDRNETRRLRNELKDNIRRGTPCSLYCAIKIPTKGLLPRSDNARYKFGMMHMTPIKDGDNVAVAFVAIFG
ncbi:hypothetical protein B0H19DRAFT_1338142 [Mycena capillaripes]|nr:hypothetical protein B0H19DRAFT_1338142 [Mycena capillaripes]